MPCTRGVRLKAFGTFPIGRAPVSASPSRYWVGEGGWGTRARVACRAASGRGFGPGPGGESEPEPTALAGIALGDAGAAAWLSAHQGPTKCRRAPGAGVERQRDRARGVRAERCRAGAGARPRRGRAGQDHARQPHRSSRRLAPRLGVDGGDGRLGRTDRPRGARRSRGLRPTAPEIADGVGYLGDRACVGGGWNYGNRAVYGEDLPPYAQTTAAAMLALRPGDGAVFEQGLAALGTLWPKERHGGLSLAMTLAAATAHGDPMRGDVSTAMASLFGESGFLGDTVALAWAAIATGPGLDTLIGGGP